MLYEVITLHPGVSVSFGACGLLCCETHRVYTLRFCCGLLHPSGALYLLFPCFAPATLVVDTLTGSNPFFWIV